MVTFKLKSILEECILRYKYRTILKMVSTLMNLCAIMGRGVLGGKQPAHMHQASQSHVTWIRLCTLCAVWC